MRTNIASWAAVMGIVLVCAGCLVDDRASARGQSKSPSATVPDSGSPARRESASDTLNNAEQTSPASGDVKVEKP
jgi:hypothetical protein